ncbi:G-patch domain-containing protein [Colletotrichum abscissum]|uniref:G-patch domain-containing protein n=1 Tax=Colletotrichum abscissum TaxID=1671311 RepID=UPI0027D5F942|nr:G-patch domain-containing protein [Colletotrichum abscissum]KAK1492438.1 G-patch domain-containing protein [Colletotrichum abscissum]
MYEDNHRARERGPYERRRSPLRDQQQYSDNDGFRTRQATPRRIPAVASATGIGTGIGIVRLQNTAQETTTVTTMDRRVRPTSHVLDREIKAVVGMTIWIAVMKTLRYFTHMTATTADHVVTIEMAGATLALTTTIALAAMMPDVVLTRIFVIFPPLQVAAQIAILVAIVLHRLFDKLSDLSQYPSVDLRIPSTGRGKPPIPQPSHLHLLTSPPGKRRAFAQFENVGQADEFVKANYPKLVINFFSGEVDDSTDGMTLIYIHYARNRDDTERESRAGTAANWSCPTCDFSNYATRSRCKNCGGPPTDPSQYRFLLTGESDASDTPSQILVFFPLAPSVNEDVFSAGAGKLELVQKQAAARNSGDGPKLKSTAPTGDASGYGARPGSLHRTFLMRDQETNESFNFGFAEFWTVEDAMAAMKKFQMMREFTIATKPVTVSTIHLGVFVPELREVTRFNERVSFNPLFNPAIRVKYWEPHVYPSQRVITEVPPGGTSGDGGKGDAADEAKKGKKRKADGNLPASSTKKSVPMAGQMAFWQKRHVEIHEGKRAADAVGENGQSEERAPVRISLSGANAISTGPIKISLTGASLPKAPAPTASPNGAPTIENSQTPAPQTGTAAPDKTSTPEASVSYVDREKICCLICMMKYKSLDDLSTHEKSRNHKNATADEEKVKAAKPRLAARDKRMAKQAEEQPAAPAADEESAPQYRDRAKERREVFNQPAKPKVPVQGGNKPARKDDKTANPPAAASKEKTPPPAPPKSKGAGMLAKMGWSTGQGLGANGDGRTEVIATHAYQEGVGLGAEGGNLGDAAELAQRKTTNSYAEYVNTVQDRARERYNKLG